MVSRRWWVIASSTLVVALAAGSALWVVSQRGNPRADVAVPTASAAVVRTTLSSTTQLSGTLGHGPTYPILYQGRGGTLTQAPAAGTIVTQGEPLFEVDGVWTRLLFGVRPSWRDLQVGVAPGPDVQQLEQDLTDLGYATGLSMTIDNTFTSATARALERWQRAVGYPVDGRLRLGTVSFQPGAVRVEEAAAGLGEALGSGQPAISADSATVSVIADVPTAQTFLVHAGDKVTVTLPSGKAVGGVIGEISHVASNAGATGSSAGQQGNAATVPATVSLDDPSSAGGLDRAPVTVNVTDRTVANVLAVPITALVALNGGGYGLYVLHGTTKKLVAATPGLFATSLVQVTSPELHVGDLVQVPAS